ncbi:MAG: hypothetical protein GXO57_02540 [Thermodesulfobacteria bacterium]|nr:hypothetical protein [Thermodesulfobacteriota bacterium]
MKKVVILLCLGLMLGGLKSVYASKLIFEFTNPSFGGSPFYGSFLLQEAQMQNLTKKPSSSIPTYQKPSFLEEFTSILQRQIAYTLAHKLVEQVFGETENSLEPGTYTVGDLEISIGYTGEGVELTLTDTATGETTQLIVPQFTPTQTSQ